MVSQSLKYKIEDQNKKFDVTHIEGNIVKWSSCSSGLVANWLK